MTELTMFEVLTRLAEAEGRQTNAKLDGRYIYLPTLLLGAGFTASASLEHHGRGIHDTLARLVISMDFIPLIGGAEWEADDASAMKVWRVGDVPAIYNDGNPPSYFQLASFATAERLYRERWERKLAASLPFSIGNYPRLAATTAGVWVRSDDELIGRLIGVVDELGELADAPVSDDEHRHFDVAWYVVRSLQLLGYLRYDWVWPLIVERAYTIAQAIGDPDERWCKTVGKLILAIVKKAQRRAYGAGDDGTIVHALWENHTHTELRDLLLGALALCFAYGLKVELSPEEGLGNNIEKLMGRGGRHRQADGTIAFNRDAHLGRELAMEGSKISWTGTFDPATGLWTAGLTWNWNYGCTKVSPACNDCYAEDWAKRVGIDFGTVHHAAANTFNAPLRWQRKLEREGRTAYCFTCSLGDFFHPAADDWRAEVWEIIRSTPNITYLILTKRHERMVDCLPADWGPDGYANCVMGVTAENQRMADKRIPVLLKMPARRRFISAEPLLGPLDLWQYLRPGVVDLNPESIPIVVGYRPALDQVITGGNSGHKMAGVREHLYDVDGRTYQELAIAAEVVAAGNEERLKKANTAMRKWMRVEWARSVREQCVAAGVALFEKQRSGRTNELPLVIDGLTYKQRPGEMNPPFVVNAEVQPSLLA